MNIQKTVLITFASFSFLASIVYVFIGIYGSAKWWYDIPDRDMWYGYLGSWVAFRDGDWEALWAPHNEHRLFVSKLFFYLDLSLFRGSQIFLHVLIFVILLLITSTYLLILQKLTYRAKSSKLPDSASSFILSATVIAVLWSWIQYENFIWAFQIQFLLAVLLPLWTFLSLALTASQTNTRGFVGFYFLTLLLSTLSVFTTANGLLVPWLTAVMILVLRFRWVWALGPLVVGVVSSVGYVTSGYQVNVGSNASSNVVQGIADVLRFFVAYLSGPVTTVLSSQRAGVISVVILAILLLSSIYLYFSKKRPPLYLALIVFAGFVILSGLVIALGRVEIGYPTSSRYQTPLLAGWVAVLLLFVRDLQTRIREAGIGALVLVLTILLGFWSYQLKALEEPSLFIKNKRLGTLALALQIPDNEAISPVMPQIDFALDYGNRARLLGVTALGREPYVSLRQNLGLPFQGEFGECSVSIMDGPRGMYGDLGSLAASVQTSGSRSLDDEVFWLVDASDRTVGYAMSDNFDSLSSMRLLKGYWLPDVELANVRVGLRGATCS